MKALLITISVTLINLVAALFFGDGINEVMIAYLLILSGEAICLGMYMIIYSLVEWFRYTKRMRDIEDEYNRANQRIAEEHQKFKESLKHK